METKAARGGNGSCLTHHSLRFLHMHDALGLYLEKGKAPKKGFDRCGRYGVYVLIVQETMQSAK